MKKTFEHNISNIVDNILTTYQDFGKTKAYFLYLQCIEVLPKEFIKDLEGQLAMRGLEF